MTDEDARRLALGLPDATEEDHHGRASFRIKGRIFATLWAPGRMNIMLDATAVMDAVDANPEVCEEMWWGQRLAAVQVNLVRASPGSLMGWLAVAHARKGRPTRTQR